MELQPSSSSDEKENQFFELGKSILKRKNIDAELIFFCRAGSHSFNLNVETSDSDYFGVYEIDIDLVLSGSVTAQQSLIDGHEPEDFVIYSKTMMGDAKRLTSNNNSGKKPMSTELSSNHSPNKKLYHTIRLLNETVRMLDGKDPEVFLTGEHREYIMSIRRGEIEIEKLEQEVARLYMIIDEKMQVMQSTNPNNIPSVADSKLIDNWVISCRKQTMLSANNSEEYFSMDELKLDVESSSDLIKNVYSRALEVLRDNKVDGSVLYIGRTGSHLHNLQVEDVSSDDWFVVFAASLDHVFSIEPTPTRLESIQVQSTTTSGAQAEKESASSRDTYVNGVQLIEVGYFLSLLSQGNHRAVELFYAEQQPTTSLHCKAWNLLNQHSYMSYNFMQHCWGVAQGQLAKVKSLLKNNNSGDEQQQQQQQQQQQINKHLYHSFRLLKLSEQVADSSSRLEVTVSSESRDSYLMIRSNQQPQQTQSTLQKCTDISNKITIAIKEKKNQEQTNNKLVLANWLAKLRKSLSK
ncbi:hypothetical protein PPL_11913 [Heterostelium album PN500]|uniref:Uncharacterized protein n=1 Tax=Heterostelium pallidum (strain ATCC 26659 / Pp 5 / PN500) TaxID=670386 RepID=D3BUU1_HETP5|nr:hypothetical protein PPL_11913 [Heterostelium album PN500]EFA74879.1 hypothetical protein PPL_11913 [Heterostelium album PN500]|eukprot:XP_020427013.1 hypothetical protein PPL_11913 [Heterostelium album PN500]